MCSDFALEAVDAAVQSDMTLTSGSLAAEEGAADVVNVAAEGIEAASFAMAVQG